MHTSHALRAALGMTFLAAAFAATTASAEERAINATATIDADGLLTVYAVGPMPKGLFTIGNKLVRNKGVLTVSYIIAESDCFPAATGTISSTTTGTFIPFLNPTGQTVAYGWTATADLSAQQNHWHNFINCDGSVEQVGCQGDRTVSLNFTLTTPGGADWGQETTGATLPSVQDPDEYEQNCCDDAVQDAGRDACDDACRDSFHACKAACPTTNCGQAPRAVDYRVCTGTGPTRVCSYPGLAAAEAAYAQCLNDGTVNYGACVSTCAQSNGDCHQACDAAWPSCPQ